MNPSQILQTISVIFTAKKWITKNQTKQRVEDGIDGDRSESGNFFSSRSVIFSEDQDFQ